MRAHLFASTILLLAACNGSSVSLNDLPTKLVAAICAQGAECGQYPDVASCEASNHINNGSFQTIVDAVNAKQIKYDANAAGACVDFFANQGCQFPGDRMPTTNVCQTVFTGLVAAGGACFISTECAGGPTSGCQQTNATCDPSVSCCPGTCVAGTALPPKGGVGATCMNTIECQDTLYCSNPAGTGGGTCKTVITTNGATCDAPDSCANPMYCQGINAGSTGTCMTAAATGATCVNANDVPCADSRDYCDASTHKCTRDVAVGGTCGGTNNAVCVGYADCTGTTCVARVKAGGTCTATTTTCLGSLQCTAGTCQLPPDTSMACQ